MQPSIVVETTVPAAHPIGAPSAFALLLLLGLLAPWPIALLLFLVTAGGAVIALSLFPQLYLAVFPFVFATTDQWSGNFLFPWPLGLLLTLFQWVAICVPFSYYAQGMSRLHALKAAAAVVLAVWVLSLLCVIVLGVHAPPGHVRT
jgi:hypothetical protein